MNFKNFGFAYLCFTKTELRGYLKKRQKGYISIWNPLTSNSTDMYICNKNFALNFGYLIILISVRLRTNYGFLYQIGPVFPWIHTHSGRDLTHLV